MEPFNIFLKTWELHFMFYDKTKIPKVSHKCKFIHIKQSFASVDTLLNMASDIWRSWYEFKTGKDLIGFKLESEIKDTEKSYWHLGPNQDNTQWKPILTDFLKTMLNVKLHFWHLQFISGCIIGSKSVWLISLYLLHFLLILHCLKIFIFLNLNTSKDLSLKLYLIHI